MGNTIKYWYDGQIVRSTDSDNRDQRYWYDGTNFEDVVPAADVIEGTAGIASGEAFGANGVLVYDRTLGVPGSDTGIPSGFAAGADGALTSFITGSTGIPSDSAFGSDGVVDVGADIYGTAGIPSLNTFGLGGELTAQIGDSAVDAGIASGEAFGAGGAIGTGLSGAVEGVGGIASGEAFGSGGTLTPALGGDQVGGIPSAEAFGDTGFLYGSDDVQMPFRFYINGIDRTQFYSPTTLRVENPKASNSTAEFTFQGIAESLADRKVFRQVIPASEPSTFDLNTTITRQSVEVYKNYIPQKYGTHFTIVSGDTISFLTGFEPAEDDVVEVFYFDPTNVVFVPTIGDKVLVYCFPFVWNATERITEMDTSQAMRRIFAGTIEDIHVNVSPTTKHSFYSIGCTDYTQRIGKRQFTFNFAGGSLTSLLTQMQRQIFDGEGIVWVDRADPGLTFPAREYDGPADDVLNELGNATGWDWKIDYFGNFRMSRTPIAPVSFEYGTLTDDDDKTRVVSIAQTRAKYRNVQGVRRTGLDRTNRTTESFTVPGTGDATGTYSVKLFMEDKPIVTVNGTPQVVDSFPPTLSDYDCYFDPDNYTVQFRDGHRPPASAAVVIQYTSELGNVDYYADDTAITTRAAQEGGSGRYERVTSFGGFSGVNTADLAAGLTDRFGEIDTQATIETDRFGILPGQQIELDFTNPPMSGTFYIESVSSVDEGGVLLRHTLQVSANGKKGMGVGDTLGGGIGSGGGWGGGDGGGGWGGGYDGGDVNIGTDTGSVNVFGSSAPQRYEFPVAPSMLGCANPGMTDTGPVTIPRIVTFPGIIRDVQGYVGVHGGDQAIIFDVQLNGVSIFDDVADQPTFEPHGTTPNYAASTFNKMGTIRVVRGDLLTVVLQQNGASLDIADPSAEEMGQDGVVVVTIY